MWSATPSLISILAPSFVQGFTGSFSTEEKHGFIIRKCTRCSTTDVLHISQTSMSACCPGSVRMLNVWTPKEATGAHVNQATCWTLKASTVSVSIITLSVKNTSNASFKTVAFFFALHWNMMDMSAYLPSGQGSVWPEGAVLPIGVGRHMLSATCPTHHQADLLLQPSGQGLGRWVRSLSFAGIRYSHQRLPRSCCCMCPQLSSTAHTLFKFKTYLVIHLHP